MDNNRKRRVLFVGEASFLATGFSTYWNEVLKRLHSMGEFELFEIGSYAHGDDHRCQQIPWKFYPVAPPQNNQEAMREYQIDCNGRFPTRQFGEGIFSDVCLDCRPDLVFDIRDFWMCFKKGTPTVCGDGSIKSIEDIRVGDDVLSHTGETNKVINTFNRLYTGVMYQFKASNLTIPITMTAEHPVLVVPRRKKRSLNKQWDTKDATWKIAKDITRDDFLCLPINKKILDDSRYTTDLCRLIGYYLSQGCLMYEGKKEENKLRGIQLTLRHRLTEYAEDILRLITEYFSITPTINKRGNCSVIRAFGSEIAKFFLSNCGDGANNKKIHQSLYQLPDEKIAGLLCGLVRGDGCINEIRGSYNTVSRNLGHQTFMLLCRLGVIPSFSCNKNPTGKGPGDHYRYIMEIRDKSLKGYSDIYHNCNPPKQRDCTRSNNDYVFLTIKSIDTQSVVDHAVYNFEVEKNNSYVTSFAVHNCEFIDRSPLRNYFNFTAMPTIDGEPQRQLWLDMYKRCDGILTYSEYGMNLLKSTGRRDTNLITIAHPGVDLDVFCPPEDKRAHKRKLGIDPNSLIIGMVARNQKRKLYYDLIQAFSEWVYRAKSKGHVDLAKRTFLYLHTSYPDVGYDLAKAIQEFKVGNRVIMTYLCSKCGAVYPSFFAGDLVICRKCGKLAAHPPNANSHCPRNVLADIMKTFDLCVQYSVCLHPDTPIMTSCGWENIGDIRVGDQVVGKDGKLHRVYKTMKNPSEQCYDITIKGRPWSITATDNHPWLVVDKTGISKGIEGIINRERCHLDNNTKCPELKFIYKRTDELKPNDLLVNKVPEEEILPDDDLPFMNNDMAYYLGLFITDGHANKTRAVSTNICDTQFRNILGEMCYHRDDTKQLPIGCHLWPRNLQEALVRGLMSGDRLWHRPLVNVYSTTSIHIAKMLGPILERLGWYYNCSITYRDSRLPMYRFEIETDGQRKSHETLYRNGFVLTKIKSVDQSNFDGEVINIDVEDDHHYVTLQGLQHNCEGAGMPPLEAMACGVPVMAVDYSAMQDYFNCKTSTPIRVQRFFYEAIIETEQKRALPDNADFVNKLDKFLKQSEDRRSEQSRKTREYMTELTEVYGTEQKLPRFSWDRTAAIWAQVIREAKIKNQDETWMCPKSLIRNPNLVPPSNDMDNGEFVDWVIEKVWGHPEMLGTHFSGIWLQNLNSRSKTVGDQRVPFGRKDLVEHFVQMVNEANRVESKRVSLLQKQSPSQIQVTVI